MQATPDLSQYRNEIQHYHIRMLNRILTTLDRNSKSEAMSVMSNLVNWSQAFYRQNHNLGIKSFIENGVRPTLIPVLISFFKDRRMSVQWNSKMSSEYPLNGGGPQGDVLGILEYLSQTNKNTDFLSVKHELEFINDLSFLECINLILKGLSS